MVNNPLRPRRGDRDLVVFGVVFALTLGVWVVAAVLPFAFYPDLARASNFGEAFGFVEALFSALAMLGVIYTIHLQRRDLALTQWELRRSAVAQEQSERALAEQARAMETVARLNAINAMARLYAEKIQLCRRDDVHKRTLFQKKFEHYREELEIILAEMRPTELGELRQFFDTFLDGFAAAWGASGAGPGLTDDKLHLLEWARSELEIMSEHGCLKDTAMLDGIGDAARRLGALRRRAEARVGTGDGAVDDEIHREVVQVLGALKAFRRPTWE
ncbi:MAG TPA: hypothetical protein VF590_01595 [Isosphaeraceae bacterium]|jgi:hypothetical protein